MRDLQGTSAGLASPDTECFRNPKTFVGGCDQAEELKLTKKEITTNARDTDNLIAAGAALVSAVPWLGGPVSSVLSSYSQSRKFNRIKEVLDKLSEELREFRSKASEEFVKTEAFEDLLEYTLRRVADERQSSVRALYCRFLNRAISDPNDDYDSQIEILRAIELLRSGHVAVLGALIEDPEPVAPLSHASSHIQTLVKRTSLDRESIRLLVDDLNHWRLTKLDGLNTMMTGRGAASLQHTVAPLGRKVSHYLMERNTSGA